MQHATTSADSMQPVHSVSASAFGSGSLRQARWYTKLRSDPKRWAERMEAQRKRREAQEIREIESKQERDRWAKLPKDHPRKTRKPKRKPETVKAKARLQIQRLPDCVVANRYLHMRVTICPKELIEIKRQHIRLNRALGTRIKSL